MAIPLRQLENGLKIIVNNIEDGVVGAIIVIGEGLAREIVPATPVATGLARGNWRPSLNAPSTRPLTFLDPTGAATIARIIAVSRSYRLGDTIFIVNRVPYIGDLNRGSSPQAPAGFVDTAIKAGVERGLAVLRGGIA